MNLAQLIATHRGDRSNLELAAACGNRPSPQRWGDYANGKEMRNFPDPPTVKAIAQVLGINERIVVLACAETLGLDTSEFSQPTKADYTEVARRRSPTTQAPVDPGDSQDDGNEEPA